MRIRFPLPAACAAGVLLAAARLPAAPAETAPAPTQARDVTIVENEAFYSIENGKIIAVVAKNSGDLVSLKYNGQEMLATATNPDGTPNFAVDRPGNPGRGGFMTDHMYGFWSHDTDGAPRIEAKVTIDPKTNGGERAEVSVKGFSDGQKLGHGPGAPRDGDFAADIEIRYTLGRDDSGVYTYCIFEHKPEYPNATMGEARFCAKLNSFLDWMLVDKNHHMLYPAELERAGDNKYNYTTGQFEHPAFGWASAEKQMGCFLVNASTEYLSGGPTKVEFLVHRDTTGPNYYPCILNYWRSSHYGGSSVDVAQGEHWMKVVGPFLLYCNSGGDPLALWADAIAQQKKEAAQWPYKWVASPAYPLKEQRGTVTGRLAFSDPVQPGAKMGRLLVGVSHPDYHVTTNRPAATNTPADVDWMTDAKHYQFWVVGNEDGSFTIPNIHPGNYTLHAFAEGVLGEFAKTDLKVAAGQTVNLGELAWTPVRRGKQLWDIGVPNRNASEYFKGDDHFHDGMALVYRDQFPNDVNFVIGQSDYKKDWFFQHVPHVEAANARPSSIGGSNSSGRASPWKIVFNLPETPKGQATLRVAIAGGSVSGGRIPVTLNGEAIGALRINGDSTVGRNQIQGLWYERELAFPAALLKAGENVLQLTVPAGGATNGVVYDYLRLELDEAAAPAPVVAAQ